MHTHTVFAQMPTPFRKECTHFVLYLNDQIVTRELEKIHTMKPDTDNTGCRMICLGLSSCQVPIRIHATVKSKLMLHN